MLVQTKYFGQVECGEEQELHFPRGLFGFEEEKSFLLLPFEGSGGSLLCFQSAVTPHLAFVAMNPFYLKPDYAPVLTGEELRELGDKPFPVLNDAKGEQMRQAIREAKEEGDSVGGSIECAVVGLPAGLGAPDFGRNVEGIFSQYLFAVPAVKAVCFGAGVALSYMRGTEANDPFEVRDGKVVTRTNHAGGVNGGITNGMPVLFEVTLRPTPSIALPQESVDLRTGEETELEIRGRHDPCVVHRAVPVIEAAAALAACEVLGM